MAASELQITSFDPSDLKSRLIDYLSSKEEFEDFNYEGSAINTFIDLLVRNDVYIAYMANMLSNESFINSAQIRKNVVSHAEKLSYVSRSTTSAELIFDVSVTPDSLIGIEPNIVLERGHPFINSVGGISYTFTANSDYLIPYNSTSQKYELSGVVLHQGELVTNTFVYDSEEKRVVIPNDRIDTSTMTVQIADSNSLLDKVTYTKVDSIRELKSDSKVYFLGEGEDNLYYIEFGRDILGVEPSDESTITITYINTEENHGNGTSSILSASPIGGYSDISAVVTQPAYGGYPREDIETIRFLAPKAYQSQNRALNEWDYIPIIKQNFPFVKSVIAWGGETNNPPVYGTIFLSILTDDFSLLTLPVKRQIESFLKDYRVGAIIPSVVDPEIFGIDLDVGFSYDKSLTSKSFNELSSDIFTETSKYNDTEIGNFSKYYNNARVINSLMSIKGIESVVLTKIMFKDIPVLRFIDPIYVLNFKNKLIPGSVSMTGFNIAINSNGTKLYDLEGEIRVSYKNEFGVTVDYSVGTIDYDSGEIEFVINMLQNENVVRFVVEPQDNNLYVGQNSVLYINQTTSSKLSEND